MDLTTERNIYIPILKGTPLFKTMAESEIDAVLMACVRRDHEAGETILSEGEPGNSMMIIVDGSVEYVRGSKFVGKGTVGDFFGEIAMLAKGSAKRQATVKALSSCTLLEIYQPSFKDMLRKHPEVGVMVIQMLASRIQAAAPASGLNDNVNRTFIAMGLTAVIKLVVKHAPPDMLGPTVLMIADQIVLYAMPILTIVGLLVAHVENKRRRARLAGTS